MQRNTQRLTGPVDPYHAFKASLRSLTSSPALSTKFHNLVISPGGSTVPVALLLMEADKFDLQALL